MFQNHSMILWSYPKDEDFEDVVNKIYTMFDTLRQVSPDLFPNYRIGKKKREYIRFTGTYEEIKNILLQGVNKEGIKVFDDLGYSASFSISNNKDLGTILFTIGVKYPKLKNIFIFNLPTSVFLGNQYKPSILITIFKKYCEVFEPFWGCISNSDNINCYDGYWKNEKPSTVHWLNYFGESLVQRIGCKKIESAPVAFIEKQNQGYLILLKDSPIENENQKDLELQRKVNTYFNL